MLGNSNGDSESYNWVCAQCARTLHPKSWTEITNITRKPETPRACNIRKRTSPPLGAGYCANGVVTVFTSLSVRELLSSSPSAVAQVGSLPALGGVG
jgi:hypothetical protein